MSQEERKKVTEHNVFEPIRQALFAGEQCFFEKVELKFDPENLTFTVVIHARGASSETVSRPCFTLHYNLLANRYHTDENESSHSRIMIYRAEKSLKKVLKGLVDEVDQVKILSHLFLGSSNAARMSNMIGEALVSTRREIEKDTRKEKPPVSIMASVRAVAAGLLLVLRNHAADFPEAPFVHSRAPSFENQSVAYPSAKMH